MSDYRWMLDTNVVSGLVRDPQGRISQMLRQHIGDGLCVSSIITTAELRFGAARKQSARLLGYLEAVLSAIDILPFEEPADRVYGEIRAYLTQAGQPIGPNDLLIAAHALSIDAALVTRNTIEFQRVRGLTVTDWA